MANWTDTFTHDYFADSTYTLNPSLAGAATLTEGTDFEIVGDQLIANVLAWVDTRPSGIAHASVFDIEVDVAETAHVGSLEFGWASLADNSGVLVALANTATAPSGVGEVPGQLAVVGIGGTTGWTVSVGTGGQWLPTSGPATVKLSWDGTTLSLAINGTVVATMNGTTGAVTGNATAPTAGSAPTWGTASWAPLVIVGSQDVLGDQRTGTTVPPVSSAPNPVTITKFSYDYTGPLVPASMTIGALPSSLWANGSSTATVTVRLADASAVPVPGETVTIGPQCGSVTDHGDGSYTAEFTSSTVPGVVEVTGADAAHSLSATTPISQLAIGSINPGQHSTGVVR